MRQLDEATYVAGQIRPDQLEAIKAAGIVMIVNNRPDGEEPGQPIASTIEAAAREAGLGYRFIPVASGLSAGQVNEMVSAVEEAGGPILAFCKSGTRSAFLWGLARAQMGEPVEALIAKGARAGYDLRSIQTYAQR